MSPLPVDARESPMRKHYDFSKSKRGPVVTLPKGKTCTTINVDDDVLFGSRPK